jgi:hypothetical protein
MATRTQAERALDLFEKELSRRKNVVGLGIVPETEEATAARKGLAVAVYVKKKVPANKLREKDLVPETLPVPGRDGPVHVPTRVIEQGEVRLEPLENEAL